MAGEILSFQIGQSGNAIGSHFWKSLAGDHGIGPDGRCATEPKDSLVTDNKRAFFVECESGRQSPHCLMLGLQPRAIDCIRKSEYGQLFHQKNMFCGTGGGAKNNWAVGYLQGKAYSEDLLEMVLRETETMDLMEGSIISHSISGGTGSGLGSYVLEMFADYFPKKKIQTYSVFSSLGHTEEECLPHFSLAEGDGCRGHVVVEPYNSALTLKRLVDIADSVVVLHNKALQDLTSAKCLENANQVIGDIMMASLTPIRYPSWMYRSLGEIVSYTAPITKLHFLMAGYYPLRQFGKVKPLDGGEEEDISRSLRTSVNTTLRQLRRLKSMLVSITYHDKPVTRHRYMFVLNLLQGKDLSKKSKQNYEGVFEFQNEELYFPWVPAKCETTYWPSSPYKPSSANVSELSIVNHSSIIECPSHILNRFYKLYKREAFVEHMQMFSGFGDLRSEVND